MLISVSHSAMLNSLSASRSYTRTLRSLVVACGRNGCSVAGLHERV